MESSENIVSFEGIKYVKLGRKPLLRKKKKQNDFLDEKEEKLLLYNMKAVRYVQ